MFFTNCHMESLNISSLGTIEWKQVHLHMNRCQIGGYIEIQNVKVVLHNIHCSLKTYLDSALLVAFNSTVDVKSSSIVNFTGGFLQMTQSICHLFNMNFLHCISSPQRSLFGVLNESLMTIKNCTYFSNVNSLVYVANNSTAFISNSVFQHNEVEYIKQNLISLLRAAVGSFLVITQSHFSKNTIQNGTAVVVEKDSALTIHNSTFNNNQGGAIAPLTSTLGSLLAISFSEFSNNTLQPVTETAVVSVLDESVGIIENSTFSHNQGTAVAFDKSAGLMSNCWFHHNSAEFGAASQVLAPLWIAKSRTLKNIWRNFPQPSFELVNMSLPVHIVHEDMFPGLEVHDCLFAENVAEDGGAIAAENVSLILQGCYFSNNSALGSPTERRGFGGALGLVMTEANITKCVFEDNKAQFGGGALYALQKLPTIESSVFNRNQALEREISGGGAIHIDKSLPPVEGSVLVISDSSFGENEAFLSGGAIYAIYYHIRMNASIFHNNKAAGGGAVVFVSGEITHCTFDTNTAKSRGGALFMESTSNCSISHSYFTHNSAGQGGAIYAENVVWFSCAFCVFHNNTAAHNGFFG